MVPEKATDNRSGQSLIESCIAIALLCLILFGLLQISQIFAAKEILAHAAARGARAKTVGFNRWMVRKAVKVAAIPIAGKIVEPEFINEDEFLRTMIAESKPGEAWDKALGVAPSSLQQSLERARIPEYLASYNWERAEHVLDYEHWNDVHHSVIGAAMADPDVSDLVLHVRARHTIPLWVPMHKAFHAGDELALSADSYIENHYPLFINDMNW